MEGLKLQIAERRSRDARHRPPGAAGGLSIGTWPKVDGKKVKYDQENTGYGWRSEAEARPLRRGAAHVLPDEAAGRTLTSGAATDRGRAGAQPGASGAGASTVAHRPAWNSSSSRLLNGVSYGLLLFMLSSGPDADLQHDGRAQLRPRVLLHDRRLLRLPDQRSWIGFWPGLVVAPLLVGVHRRGDRALRPAPRAQVRSRGRTAVHLRAGLHHRRAGADHLGARGGAVSGFRTSSTGSLFTVFATTFPGLPRLHDAGRGADAAGDSG